MSRPDRPDRPALPALTGLRFFAALHVVAYHALRPVLVDAADPPSRFLANGAASVTLFFVLSGFILTWVYAGRETPIDRRAFFVARFARIAPVYWLALLLVLPLGLLARLKGIVHDPLGPVSFVLVLTGTQAWIPEAALRWNPPAWSLSCELFFYALFPWLAAALFRVRAPRAVHVGAVAWALGVSLPLLYLALDPDGLGNPRIVDETPWLQAVKLNPLARLPDFIVGVVAGRLFIEGLRVPAVLGAAALAAALLAASSGWLPGLTLHNGVLAPLFAATLLWLAAPRDRVGRLLSSLLSRRPLLALGEASYALYLLHVPLMMWAMAGLRQRDLAPRDAATAAFLAVPLALLVYALFERPLRTAITGRLATRG
jgi:peptidoglycan/LPS O-acetylase OafA/YrhL